jgi:hypothetical protein
VRNEAALASERERLVPVLIEDVKQPLEFRRRQAVDLTGWRGDQNDPEFLALCQGLAAKAERPSLRSDNQERGGNVTPNAPDAATAALNRPRGRITWRHPYVIGAAVAIAALVLWLGRTAFVGGDEGRHAGEASLQQRVPDSGLANASSVSIGGDAEAPRGTLSLRAVDRSSGRGRHNDDPVSLDLDTITRVRLESNEAFYLRLTAPMRGVDLVLDVRLVDNYRSNLLSTVSVLDENGGVLRDGVIAFNDIDRTGRVTASYEGTTPVRLGFRLQNGAASADHWLTVRRSGSVDLVPFLGELKPAPLELGQTYMGRLEVNERVYHRAALPSGEYQAVVDFVRQPPSRGNIRGALLLLDATGKRLSRVLDFNQIDLSYRKVGTFTVSQESPVLLETQSGGDTIDYSLRVQRLPAVATEK